MKKLKVYFKNKKNLPLIISIVVVVIAVVIIGWVIYKDHHKKVPVYTASPQSFNIAYKDAVDQANLRKFNIAIPELNNAVPANQFQAIEKYFELGQLYYSLGSYNQSLNSILKSYNLDPSYANSEELEFISQVYAKLGNSAMSTEFNEKAIKKAETGKNNFYGLLNVKPIDNHAEDEKVFA